MHTNLGAMSLLQDNCLIDAFFAAGIEEEHDLIPGGDVDMDEQDTQSDDEDYH